MSSREGKRNRKAQALSALLSASALGVFLEGFGGSGSEDGDTGYDTDTTLRSQREIEEELADAVSFTLTTASFANHKDLPYRQSSEAFLETSSVDKSSAQPIVVFAEGDGIHSQGPCEELEDTVGGISHRLLFGRDDEDIKDILEGGGGGADTLGGYFVSKTNEETAYSIEVPINDEEAFVPAVEG